MTSRTPSMLHETLAPLPGAACHSVRALLSEYLDGAVTGVEMRRIASHLSECAVCQAEFSLAQATQATLSRIGQAKAPAELSLRLRVAISQERRRSWPSRLGRLSLTWKNALRPLVMPACAGLASAIVFLGSVLFLLGALGSANPVMANDEPLGAITAPHYLYSMAGIQPVHTAEDGTIVVEASVNARGEVYDYKIVSGPEDVAVRNQVLDRLLASVFQPASVFGVPIRGQVIMTFAGVSVRG